jgi:hypothetical protein
VNKETVNFFRSWERKRVNIAHQSGSGYGFIHAYPDDGQIKWSGINARERMMKREMEIGNRGYVVEKIG